MFTPQNIAILCCLLCPLTQRAAEADSTAVAVTDTASVPQRKGLVQKVISYFGDANKEKPGNKLDFSVIGGPYYTSEMGLGIGLVASGIYGHGIEDPDCPPSNLSFFGKISTKGFGSLGVRGTHISRNESMRINYLLELLADPSDYWGIGYKMDNRDSNQSSMKRLGVKFEASALYHIGYHLYLGPVVTYDFVKAHSIQRRRLLDGQRSTTWAGGAGVALSYDTRDVLTNPHRGLYAMVSQCFYPKFIGNEYAFSSTRIQLDWYKTVWDGGILATDVRATFNTGNPSWYMMASVGGAYFMRGYYEGRYRDKHMAGAQVELRQRVYRRSGITVWGGAATVFRKFSQVEMRRLLPNVGIGYRWEFKKDVNVRLDAGIGKSGQWGFLFNINEAF